MKIFKRIIIVVLWISCVLLSGCGEQEELLLLQPGDSVGMEASVVVTEPPRQIAVYVCGQVLYPGVVYLDEDARAVDAVEAAGGLTEAADAEYINLAARVSDGEKLYIPDVQEGQELREREAEAASDLVNINTADRERLMTLPGIGESKAQDIIAYREECGEFASIEELMNISGIKESLFEKIRDKIVVE
ncbi:MAG: helix-hairpin-helix domain-containing protein [Lachnospiraceae bacterium]|nr:helix-hairpin-helix domain-containing protein [Lachnospiraceae bacterium]